MNSTIAAIVISGAFSIIVGILTPIITINLNRAQAVKYLTEAAEKTGIENERLNRGLDESRRSILCLVRAIEKVIPLLPTDEPHREELRRIADEARINLP